MCSIRQAGDAVAGADSATSGPSRSTSGRSPRTPSAAQHSLRQLLAPALGESGVSTEVSAGAADRAAQRCTVSITSSRTSWGTQAAFRSPQDFCSATCSPSSSAITSSLFRRLASRRAIRRCSAASCRPDLTRVCSNNRCTFLEQLLLPAVEHRRPQAVLLVHLRDLPAGRQAGTFSIRSFPEDGRLPNPAESPSLFRH